MRKTARVAVVLWIVSVSAATAVAQDEKAEGLPDGACRVEVLNNLVSELMDAGKRGMLGRQEIPFTNPRDGWCFFQVVRAIPALVYNVYQSSTQIAPFGAQTWEILQETVLPDCNVIESTGLYPEEMAQWRGEGKQWVVWGGVPGLHAPPTTPLEDAYRYWQKSLGYTHPLVSGIQVDEFWETLRPEVLANAGDGITRLAADPAFEGRLFIPFVVAMYRTPEAVEMMQAVFTAGWLSATAGETPYGQGMTEANKERLVLDDMEDVSDWYNGSPEETTISASHRHVKQGPGALLFANLVDHTKGEKNYPVGWPRTGKDLASANLTDWSGYDFFECWIYAETSREALPKTPLGVGFYHTGNKRSSHFPLGEVQKDGWVKVVIPIDRLLDPKDVQRVQFNISESDYKHGDRVDFTIDDVVLTRFVEPAVAELTLGRRILYAQDLSLGAQYKLVGYKDLDTTKVELAIGRGDGPPVAVVTGSAARVGELVLPIREPLATGISWARLALRDAQGRLIDRKQAEFRVIAGPLEKE